MWLSILQPSPSVSPPTPITTFPTKPAASSFSTTTAFFPASPPRSCRRRASSSSVPEQAQDAEEEKQGSALRGSDVLWAMQQVAAVKNKVRLQRRTRLSPPPPSTTGKDESPEADYSNVKPLCVKREWAEKLDDLEERIRLLSLEIK